MAGAKGLTFNEAAMIYCILGEPDGKYPSVDEALSYMLKSPRKPVEKKQKQEIVYEQMELF